MPSPFSSSNVITTNSADSNTIDPLIYDLRWEDTVITYSFPNENARWSADPFTGYGPGEEPWSNSYTPISSLNQSDFNTALQRWESVSNIEFKLVREVWNTVGDIRITYTEVPAFNHAEAWAYLPSQGVWGGDIWINKSSHSAQQDWIIGSFSFLTIMHEIGHAIGLMHPFEDPTFPVASDTMSSTIMSYSAIPGDQDSIFDYYPTTPMPLDIVAIQHIYGANTDFNTGNDTLHYTDDATYHETIWDSGGIDTIDYTGNQAALIKLEEGQGSFIGNTVYTINDIEDAIVPNVWIAYDTIIENASGGQHNDELHGNQYDNILSGNSGNDILIGLEGNDTMQGGDGIDTARFDGKLSEYTFHNMEDSLAVMHQAGNDGQDTLVDIERLQFEDAGLAFDINGHAGQIAKLLGVIFGTEAVSNRDLVRVGLLAIDNGNTDEQLVSSVLNIAEAHNHDALVTLLWRNLLGHDPSLDEKQPFLTLLNNNQLSTTKLTLLAANTSLNADNIDLVGLAQTGIEFSI